MKKLDNDNLKIQNIKVDQRLWSQARIHAIHAGTTLREWLAKAMVSLINSDMKGGEDMPPTGKCTKCGQVYTGWGLVKDQEENICLVCGGPVIVCPDQESTVIPVTNHEK